MLQQSAPSCSWQVLLSPRLTGYQQRRENVELPFKKSVCTTSNSCCSFNAISGLIQMWHHTELRLGHWFYCQYTLNYRDFVTHLCGACVSEQNPQLETSVQFHPFVAVQWAINRLHFGIKTGINFKLKRSVSLSKFITRLNKKQSFEIWLVSWPSRRRWGWFVF